MPLNVDIDYSPCWEGDKSELALSLISVSLSNPSNHICQIFWKGEPSSCPKKPLQAKVPAASSATLICLPESKSRRQNQAWNRQGFSSKTPWLNACIGCARRLFSERPTGWRGRSARSPGCLARKKPWRQAQKQLCLNGKILSNGSSLEAFLWQVRFRENLRSQPDFAEATTGLIFFCLSAFSFLSLVGRFGTSGALKIRGFLLSFFSLVGKWLTWVRKKCLPDWLAPACSPCRSLRRSTGRQIWSGRKNK